MKRLFVAICLALSGWSGMAFAAHSALAATLCVGSGPGCYSTIQKALNVAHSGDVIHIGPGTFAGGISIDVNLTIIGAGASQTIIKGGGTGPVIRIGIYLASSEPNVSISGVTVTGGTNTSDTDPFEDSGGGIKVEPPAGATPGTIGPAGSITITNSVITGNTVRSLGGEPCGSSPAPTCSSAVGGGISNFGAMTLTNTTVSNNTASWTVSPAPDFDSAFGGGIASAGVGTLTLRTSTVSGNTVSFSTTETAQGDFAFGGGIASGGTLVAQASRVSHNTVSFETAAALPNMFASGGGIDSGGPMTMDGSTVDGNSVTMTSTSTDPSSGIGGVGGGIHSNDNGSGTIRDSRISDNQVTATGAAGFAGAAAGGVDDDNTLTLLDDTVQNNSVSTTVTSMQPSAGSFADGGGMEVDGAATIKDTTFSGNSATATSPAAIFSLPPNAAPSGTFASGGAIAFTGGSPVAHTNTMMDSVVTGNRVQATTTSGNVVALGGGITNSTALTLRDTTVSNNVGTGDGPSGFAVGGGIWNANPGGPPPQLTLIDSAVTHNQLTGSSGVALQGGGLYNDKPGGAVVTQTNSVIAQNSPDQCYGC